MTTRSIVTSHPEVQCSFCGRRLLRGEHPQVFFIAAQRRLVCELCGPRAAQEGWLREAQAQSRQVLPARPPWRGRRLFERLTPRRQDAHEAFDFIAPTAARRAAARADASSLAGAQEDALAAAPDSAARTNGSAVPSGARLAPPPVPEPAGVTEPAGSESTPFDYLGAGSPAHSAGVFRAAPAGALPNDLLELSLSSFNASEHVERVASIARLLGPPCVSLRLAPGEDQSLWITVAWDICWHRYEVGVKDPHGPRRIAEGMELNELSPEDKTANAVIDEHGRLRPA